MEFSQSPGATTTASSVSLAGSARTPSPSSRAASSTSINDRHSLSRSASIPTTSGTMPGASSRGKVTKLSYQRMGTACTLCRRRKARCEPVPGSSTCKRCTDSRHRCEFVPVSEDENLPPPRPRQRSKRTQSAPGDRTNKTRRPMSVLLESGPRPESNQIVSSAPPLLPNHGLANSHSAEQLAPQGVSLAPENYFYTQPQPSGPWSSQHDPSSHGYASASHHPIYPMTGHGQEGYNAGHLPTAYTGLPYHPQQFGENWQEFPAVSYTTASVEAGLTRLDLSVPNLFAPGNEPGSYAPGQDYRMANHPSIDSAHRESPEIHKYPSELIDPRRPRNYHR